jgi:formate hydrogenlyase subunit 3/multisubunit Na+/H+ antiporter MnhD subunit
MPTPVIFVGLPLLAGPALYFLRRRLPPASPWQLLDVWLAVGLTVLLTLLAVFVPEAEGGLFLNSLTLFGRSFVFSATSRLGAAFVFAQAALIFFLALFTQPTRFFIPAGLAASGLLAAALFVQPFLFAALFIELAVALAVFMLADEHRPVTRGPLRFLTFTSLALPFILLTGWLLEGSAASPGDAAFTAQAAALLAVGFAALLAVAPFHSWQPSVAAEAPPLAAAFVFTALRFVPVFLLLTFLNAFDWLGGSATVYRGLTVAGGTLAGLGALFAFGQRNFGRTMGYAVMVDTGAVLLGVGLGTRAGVEAALAALSLSGLALPLWAVGLALLRRAAGGDDFDALRGAAGRHPFAVAAMVTGLLSLVGFPITAGFAGRWALLTLLAQVHPTAALLLLLGTASIGLVCARGLAALLPQGGGEAASVEDRPTMITLAAGVGAVLILGIFPQWLLPAVAGAAAAFANLAR